MVWLGNATGTLEVIGDVRYMVRLGCNSAGILVAAESKNTSFKKHNVRCSDLILFIVHKSIYASSIT